MAKIFPAVTLAAQNSSDVKDTVDVYILIRQKINQQWQPMAAY
ncbi:hypothetical protein [Chryseobacterium sp. S0630]|nr:hypothetical protein [Chryseobacterium sp. S0630]